MTSRRLIVEADGGSRGNPGPAAYGALVKDAATGEVLATRAEAIGVATNNVAEYRGLVAGLEAAAEIDRSAAVEVRMDSRLVIEQMAGRWRVKHPAMQPLALAARRAFPYAQVRWRWVPREANARADALVNAALDGRRVAYASTEPIVDEAEVEPPVRTPGGWTPDLGAPTTLLLMRHGETADTLARRFSGSGGSDPPLTAHGVEQAEAAVSAARARGVDVVVTSPLRRARETARTVVDALGVPLEVDDDLTECAFGRWDGLTFHEVRERWPEEFDAWLWSTDVAPPGGESLSAVVERTVRARDRVLARHGSRTVLVVSHVTPLKTLVRLALGAPASAHFRMELPPASFSEVCYWADGVTSVRGFGLDQHLPPPLPIR